MSPATSSCNGTRTARVAIRPMERKDIPSVLKVEKEAFPLHPYDGVEYERFLADAKTYPVVAEHQGKIVGMAVMEIGRGGPWESPREDRSKSYLNEIAVSSEMKGKKIGEQLLLHVITACMLGGAASCSLWVLEELKGAQALYEKFGFADTGGREVKHYASGEKVAIRMRADGLQTPAYRARIFEIRQKLEDGHPGGFCRAAA